MSISKQPARHPLRLRKIPARYAGLVMPFLLSIFMTCIVSLISTWRSVGGHPDFIAIWASAWRWSWLIAFPTLLLVLPVVKRLTRMLVEPV